MRGNSYITELAVAARALASQSLPATLMSFADELIGDLLLVAAAGQAEASGRALTAAIATSPGSSQVWFAADSARLAPADAAFANTLNAAALDYDSLNGAVHADVVTLPAAWAMAEHCGSSPRQMVQAYLIASETVSRLSRASTGPSKGWSGTSLYGGIGAALASGLLLGLDSEALSNALGLAAVQASGSQQANVEHTLAKRLQPAFAVRNGVQAALLAKAGATAPRQALEGPFGLRALYQPGDDSTLLNGWGRDWQVFDTALKGYPTCACGHAALQALLDLRSRDPFANEDVVQVVALISPFMHRLVGGAFNPAGDLQVMAQFSLQYQLASALLRGPFDLSHLQTAAVTDPAIADMAARVSVKVDIASSVELAPATVQVRLSSGRVLEQRCEQMPGAATMPLSAAQRLAKARECGLHAQPPLDALALLGLMHDLASQAALPDLLQVRLAI